MFEPDYLHHCWLCIALKRTKGCVLENFITETKNDVWKLHTENVFHTMHVQCVANRSGDKDYKKAKKFDHFNPKLILLIGRLEAGESQSAVARHFNVHHTTINRLWHRHNQFNSTNDHPRSGRPRVTTPAQDRFIRFVPFASPLCCSNSHCRTSAWPPKNFRTSHQKSSERSGNSPISTKS